MIENIVCAMVGTGVGTIVGFNLAGFLQWWRAYRR